MNLAIDLVPAAPCNAEPADEIVKEIRLDAARQAEPDRGHHQTEQSGGHARSRDGDHHESGQRRLREHGKDRPEAGVGGWALS